MSGAQQYCNFEYVFYFHTKISTLAGKAVSKNLFNIILQIYLDIGINSKYVDHHFRSFMFTTYKHIYYILTNVASAMYKKQHSHDRYFTRHVFCQYLFAMNSTD